MAGIREDWFPTSIWYFDHPDFTGVNDKLLRFVVEERERDAEGIGDRSTVLGWHSRDDLQERGELGTFLEIAQDGVADVVTELKWDPDQVQPFISSCWAIINGNKASNKYHHHPHATLSGVYYMQACEGAGDLVFRDPRDAQLMTAPPVVEFTRLTFRTVKYKPVAGRLLIFPSWLYHEVTPNHSGQDRVCLSFNVGLRWIEPAANRS